LSASNEDVYWGIATFLACSQAKRKNEEGKEEQYMIRKMVCLTAIVLLGLTANALAADPVTVGWALWQGNVDDNWTNPDNWVDGSGNPLLDTAGARRIPCYLDGNVGIGHSKGGTYWPVLREDLIDPAMWGPFSATVPMTDGSEWGGQYSRSTIDGGKMWFGANKYLVIARNNGDTMDFIVNSGSIGEYVTGLGLQGATRWLRVGQGDSTGGGLGTMVMNGGKIYTQAMTVGQPDGTGAAGSSATINGGELQIGVDYVEASFDIAANASMTIKPGAMVQLTGSPFESYDPSRVSAMGALNLVGDATGSGRLLLPQLIFDEAALRTYFGYSDGTNFVPGNVNAIYNGGAGQFVFTYVEGSTVEVTVIPEPATMALLGIGGLCLLRRKHS
jgi:hypothetical protein